MATITSAASGNFSAGATWVGGVVPTVGDIAVAATGHTVAIDVDVTVDKVTQAGTGKFTLGNGRTLTADVEANAGTFPSGGTVEVTATSGNTAYIVGNVTGVSSTQSNIYGINVTGTGTLNLTGNVTASAGNATSEANAKSLIFTNANSTITILGNVSGNAQHSRGVQGGSNAACTISITGTVSAGATGLSGPYGVFTTNASAIINITGDVFGGNGVNAFGAYAVGSAAAINITGNVTAGDSATANGALITGASATLTITGDLYGGSSTASAVRATGAGGLITITGSANASSTGSAITSTATSSAGGVLLSGDLIDSQQGVSACQTPFFRIIDTSPSGVTRYANNASFPTGGLVSRVSPDNVTGMPAEADVRDGLTFGFNSELEGTLAVPPAASVAAGVPVDATVGTAAVRLQDVADVTGAQIAAAITAIP
jgi:hypothetical protein